jgi:hypothetical protein
MGNVIPLQPLLSVGLRRSLRDAREALREERPFLLPAFDGPILRAVANYAAHQWPVSFRPELDADAPEIVFSNEQQVELAGTALRLGSWRPEDDCVFAHALLIELNEPFRYVYGHRMGRQQYGYALLLYDGEGRPESWIAPDPRVT